MLAKTGPNAWRAHRDTIDLVIILPIEYEVAFRRGQLT